MSKVNSYVSGVMERILALNLSAKNGFNLFHTKKIRPLQNFEEKERKRRKKYPEQNITMQLIINRQIDPVRRG